MSLRIEHHRREGVVGVQTRKREQGQPAEIDGIGGRICWIAAKAGSDGDVTIWVEWSEHRCAVGRSARDYVWLMARTPNLPERDYERFMALVAELGYDTAQVRRVPQRW